MTGLKTFASCTIALLAPLSLTAQAPFVSKVWVADLGNGMYKNPILYTDYSDPDVCRVGDDYYMVASSFNAIPGLPILHSKDLVNWTLAGHAITAQKPEAEFAKPQHGNGVWAPSIRYHNGEFYIFYGDPDYGIYMVKAKQAGGVWDEATLVKPGKGLIDPCPLWDEDGKVYLVHAFAGSRAGIKSLLAVCELSADAKSVIRESVIVYDGHELDPTIEGPKFYIRNGYYYILSPAGGVATGWQVALRARNVYGPYTRKIVLATGETAVNGPHQGGWVDTPTGEDWFIHFQDIGAYGRVVHLQPMTWVDDWPVIGWDTDGDGCGSPVATYKKPATGPPQPIATPAESDEFDTVGQGRQWQWHANPMPWWAFTHAERGVLRLYSVPIPENYRNLWDVPNLLLQKFPAPHFTATAKMAFRSHDKLTGERAGLVVMGMDYALLSLESTDSELILSQSECLQADRGYAEKINASVMLSSPIVYLRVKVEQDNDGTAICTFSYSADEERYLPLGRTFKAREGKWIGAKVGLFCTRPQPLNDGGWLEVDWFRIE
ncbi:MAG: glycoside hydrolase 43 family protein [Prevotellaceae bacterium]|jgi:beta-xylosidase|nr:glycoside hydrolase 43 family protein [Prevotellaceae bacterium]